MNDLDQNDNSQNKIRANIVVKGKVQGVYFRQNAHRICNEYGVTGWVRNVGDGSVEAILEGNKNSVEDAISWFRVGPLNAHVERVELSYDRYSGEFQDFKISY
ncbi:MAG TPA: acylphosphatase [Nitrososphaeraceae archaeon]|jgi:acylphosphatase|nr:acylphosphatase [Nitrososphaeraceae archaeon]